MATLDTAKLGLISSGSNEASPVVWSHKSWLTKLLLIGTGLLLALVFLEAGLRIAGIVYAGSFYEDDLVRGWGLRPGAHGWSVGEGKVYVQINSDGMRDREHSIQRDPGTLRIAVLGDSYVEGMNVALDKTFPAVVERELSHCPSLEGRKVEVLNFGVSGYGTAQELLTLHEKVWKYRPDLILLAFYSGNDLFNNYRALNPVEADQYPYFVYQGNSLVLDNAFRNSWKMSKMYRWFFNFRGNLQNRSRVVQVFTKVIQDLKKKLATKKIDRSTAELGISDLEDIIYYPSADARMKEAWHVSEGILLLMRDEVRSHRSELWVVTLANRPQLSPNLAAKQYFMKRLGIDTLFYPDHRLRTFGEQNGIRTFNLAPLMSAYAETHQIYLNGGDRIPLGAGHWNEKGHELAGQLIASELCTESPPVARWGAPLADHHAVLHETPRP